MTKVAAPQCAGEEGPPAERKRSDCASCGRGESHLKEYSEAKGACLQEGEMQCQKARVEAWPAIISVQAFNQQDSNQCMWGKPTNQARPWGHRHHFIKPCRWPRNARKFTELATCVAIATNKTMETRLNRSGNVLPLLLECS